MADRAWLHPWERLLNRRIQESESAQARLTALAGRRFGLRLHGLPWMLSLRAESDRLYAELDPQPEALDAWVAGSAVAMAAAAAGRGEQLIREGMLEMHGDGEIAERFWALLQGLGPDWEEELTRVIGDLPAHQLARGVRAVFGFAGRTAQTLGRDLAEYLQEESRDLVSQYEQEAAFREIERLRDDVERLEARLARLERRERSGEGS